MYVIYELFQSCKFQKYINNIRKYINTLYTLF